MPFVLLALPGEVAMPVEQLRQAVPGLAGFVGMLLFPTVMAWLRLLLQFLEWNRPGLTRPRRISGLGTLRAVVLTMLLAFFFLTLFHAAGELRDIQSEAPVVGPSLQGLAAGIAGWAIYALGISALRADARRHSSDRRMGGRLR